MPVFDFASGDQLIVGDNVIFLNQFQSALIGIGKHMNGKGMVETLAVYDRSKCVAIIAKNSKEYCQSIDCENVCDHWGDAEEDFSYNTQSYYANKEGGCMPVFVEILEDM